MSRRPLVGRLPHTLLLGGGGVVGRRRRGHARFLTDHTVNHLLEPGVTGVEQLGDGVVGHVAREAQASCAVADVEVLHDRDGDAVGEDGVVQEVRRRSRHEQLGEAEAVNLGDGLVDLHADAGVDGRRRRVVVGRRRRELGECRGRPAERHQHREHRKFEPMSHHETSTS
ncbi:MAG: hypothetical protein UV82_C0011G0035 [Candidatus Magasanikbacteria bacterium GW2011_GWD2_43_18]|nr:MAG: hypothetical protein UV18_C0007G0037 [Candidatus Magasanikbacteria bacterium GW2011_GWC2_42_27]KKT04107.1 MAG: hypothetical protein UV82_C0011G0035 [Candidatus Magasanikbacteria bacterium GW2011_GWD2_43_18]KKT24714.1 MAG: hypothetical protein UW10_C0021G0012 [Candidatus Magasanikbacteria bacterium GW2011_GWA2_43_9]